MKNEMRQEPRKTRKQWIAQLQAAVNETVSKMRGGRAFVSPSVDPTWKRWAVCCPGRQTRWLKSAGAAGRAVARLNGALALLLMAFLLAPAPARGDEADRILAARAATLAPSVNVINYGPPAAPARPPAARLTLARPDSLADIMNELRDGLEARRYWRDMSRNTSSRGAAGGGK